MRRGLIVALAGILCLASACLERTNVDRAGEQRSAKTVVLTIADHEQVPGDIQQWIDTVERLSRSTLRIRVASNWRLHDLAYDRRTIRDVVSGRVAMAKIAVRAYDTVGVTTFQPLLAPLLVDSWALETRVLRSTIGQHALQTGSAQLGLVGLAVLAGPLRRPVGVSRALLAPAGFRGARIAVREGKVAAATMRALGAQPIELPAGSPLDSVDGAELDFARLADNPSRDRLHGVTVNVVLWPKPVAIVMNREAFLSLTPQQQGALRRAMAVSLTAQAKHAALEDSDAQDVVCNAGAPFLRSQPSQLAALRAALQPVYRLIGRDGQNRDALLRIAALKQGIAPDAPRCAVPRRSSNAPGAATPIDGTYTTSFTKDALVNSGQLLDASEINDENWGEQTLRLSHGRMRLEQHNAKTHSALSGRYTIHGDVIRIFTDQYRETFVFHWTIYRGTLKLRRDTKLGIGPTLFLVRPWRRTGA